VCLKKSSYVKKRCAATYDNIISLDNLLLAWKDFLKGKQKKKDVQEFELHLMGNILALHRDLVAKTYRHSRYEAFNISDPKPRNIHKARVKDRVAHRAIYRILYPFFDRLFIADSYSCRNDKGIHKALDRFRIFARKASHNHTRTVWALKCDVRKFFASIDPVILRLLWTFVTVFTVFAPGILVCIFAVFIIPVKPLESPVLHQ
jgi:RNA-directed DNA polymerase